MGQSVRRQCSCSKTYHNKHKSTHLSFPLGCSEYNVQKAWRLEGFKLLGRSDSPSGEKASVERTR